MVQVGDKVVYVIRCRCEKNDIWNSISTNRKKKEP